MRLLYVVHQFFPDCHSGTEQYCLAVARAAQRHGDEVTVLSLHPCHEDEMPPVRLFDQPYDGVPVVRLNHWRRMNPNDVLRDYENRHLDGWFQAVLDEVRPDAVHFFHLRQLGSNLLRVAKQNGLRVVVHDLPRQGVPLLTQRHQLPQALLRIVAVLFEMLRHQCA